MDTTTEFSEMNEDAKKIMFSLKEFHKKWNSEIKSTCAVFHAGTICLSDESPAESFLEVSKHTGESVLVVKDVI